MLFLPKGSDYAAAVDGIWTDILVVLFPLSFCLKKKAPKKSRHKGGLRRDSLRSYSAQSPPLCIPPMTAQPIATVSVYTRNGRRVRRLPFLREKYHACRLSFSCSQSSYTLCCGNCITSLFSRGGHSYMCCLSSFIQYDFSRPGMCSCVIDRAADIAVSMIFSCGAYMMSIADKQQTAI